VLEHLLLGGSQKACAQDVGLSTSSVTLLAKRGLHSLGLRCLPSRAPLLLAILVCLSREPFAGSRVRVSELERGGVRYLEVWFPSATAVLAETLSDAECAVARLVLQGKPYVEIAERRQTSVRTVANQVAATFRRLNISGRGELLARVAKSLR
jgi:DNA-binding CsgD family transcriptional regulator